MHGVSVYTVISANNKTVKKTTELKKDIDDKNIEEKIVEIGVYILEKENKMTMDEFCTKLKNEIQTRKIITTPFNIQNVSGEYRVKVSDKKGNNIYDKKIVDIFGKGLLNGLS